MVSVWMAMPRNRSSWASAAVVRDAVELEDETGTTRQPGRWTLPQLQEGVLPFVVDSRHRELVLDTSGVGPGANWFGEGSGLKMRIHVVVTAFDGLQHTSKR